MQVQRPVAGSLLGAPEEDQVTRQMEEESGEEGLWGSCSPDLIKPSWAKQEFRILFRDEETLESFEQRCYNIIQFTLKMINLGSG